MNRDFDAAAKTWDLNDARTRTSLAIADAMRGVLGLSGNETILDYGTGTGTVALRLQPFVKEVIAADSSRGMLEVLDEKLRLLGCVNIRTLLFDLEHEVRLPDDVNPDVVVSAMTLHHIADTRSFIAKLYQVLPVGGRVAIADLDREDGDFHPDNTGVFHHGFVRADLKRMFEEVGFVDVNTETACDMVRPTPSGEKGFSIFLLNARRLSRWRSS
jgi:ubiquinone/menaquinone biosynthesis C-methylase UbiE